MEKEKKSRDEIVYLQKRILVAFLVGIGVTLATLGGLYASAREGGVIKLIVHDAEIMQGEPLPTFTASVKFEGNEERVLDEENDYKIRDLLEELNQQTGYTITAEVDGQLDGEFKIQAQLVEELEENMLGEWSDILEIDITSAKLKVKNQFGRWEEDVFYSWEDQVRANQWIVVEGKSYYLDDNGNKTTGEVILGNTKYILADTGEMIGKENWLDPEKPMIAITLDDGPDQYLNEILDILEKNNARATFYWQGVQISKDKEAAMRRVVEQGSEIGNHTMHHPNLNKLDDNLIQNELNATNQLIEEYTGVVPKTFRPPYGAADRRVVVQAGLAAINWSVDTRDWVNDSKELTLQEMTTNIKDGDIILAHETKPWTVEALAEGIPLLQQQGFQIVTVSEMAAAKGVSLEPGSRIYSMK